MSLRSQPHQLNQLSNSPSSSASTPNPAHVSGRERSDKDFTPPPRIPGLVDSHVHLVYSQSSDELNAAMTLWRSTGVEQMVHACVHPSEFSMMQGLADQYPEVFLAVGLHPKEVAREWHPNKLDQIREFARRPKVVALGEMGLDYFKAKNTDQQKEGFRSQLRLARELNLPVIIHCRDAYKDTLEILSNEKVNPNKDLRGVMHCWGGTAEDALQFCALGMYISFSGTVTYKNSQIWKAAQVVPLEKMLIETDCPFLTPTSKRGQTNQPAYVSYVAQKIAELRNESPQKIAQETAKNARLLFGLPEPSSQK